MRKYNNIHSQCSNDTVTAIKTYNKLVSCVYRRAWPHWVHIKKASGRCSCADNKVSKYMDFTALIHPKQYWDNLSSGRRITNW